MWQFVFWEASRRKTATESEKNAGEGFGWFLLPVKSRSLRAPYCGAGHLVGQSRAFTAMIEYIHIVFVLLVTPHDMIKVPIQHGRAPHVCNCDLKDQHSRSKICAKKPRRARKNDPTRKHGSCNRRQHPARQLPRCQGNHIFYRTYVHMGSAVKVATQSPFLLESFLSPSPLVC